MTVPHVYFARHRVLQAVSAVIVPINCARFIDCSILWALTIIRKLRRDVATIK